MKNSLLLKNSIKSVAIGSFDGIHLAHQKLIKKAEGVVVIERGVATLTPGWKRTIFTKKPTFFYMLTKIKHLTPEKFIEMLEIDFPKLEKIIIGYDFSFGKDKSGSIDTIKKNFKGKVEVISEVKVYNISVHSRIIRELIKNNNLTLANKMLNRAYKIDGIHIKGQGLGAKELVPTINLNVANYTLPQGVFAVNAYINGIIYKAVCFIGHRTTTDSKFAVEVHILDNFIDKIKERVWIEFISFIRENRKFNNLAELKEQIFRDIEIAKEVLA